ncbi:MAG: excinuclease ABC subunit UvrA, partial [Candidatus Marinamargulisbacteria bacterium]
MSKKSNISIKGARVHNLQNVSLDIPKDKLVVFTGLSGSGKSSLAFDTIYAEGQRRYVESLSAYARQFLEQLDKPDVDSLDGLSPAISIDQKNASKNPRSTVGTVTEIQDYLRLLYANIGVLHCPVNGHPVRKQSAQDMFDETIKWEKNEPILILSPLVANQKGEFAGLFGRLRRQGFVRIRIDGDIKRLDDCGKLAKTKKNHSRLFESIELAIKESDGLVRIESMNTKKTQVFSEYFVSDDYQFNITELTPRLFSFNSPIGACPRCNGIGDMYSFDPDILLSGGICIEDAVSPYVDLTDGNYAIRFHADAEKMGIKISIEDAIEDLDETQRNFLYYGRYKEEIDVSKKTKSRFGWKFRPRGWEGLINLLQRRYDQTESDTAKESYERLMVKKPCTMCGSGRLNAEALAVKINGLSIADVGNLSIRDANQWVQTLALTDHERTIAAEVLKEITNRLAFLDNVGLHYLSLNRTAKTLSGGEHQRIRLATQIVSGLSGVLYVF